MRIKKTSQYIEGGAGLPSYFTEEIDTGMKWIDGKPIYRRVFTNINSGGYASQTWVNTGYIDTNIETITNTNIYYKAADATVNMVFNSSVSSTGEIGLMNLRNVTAYITHFCLEYTKKTD